LNKFAKIISADDIASGEEVVRVRYKRLVWMLGFI